MSKKGKLGLLLGLVTGSAFGFLFAPRKGSALRSKLKKEHQKSGTIHNTALEELKSVGKDVQGVAGKLYGSSGLEETFGEFTEKAKKKAEEMGDVAEKKVAAAKDKAVNKFEEVKSKIDEKLGAEEE